MLYRVDPSSTAADLAAAVGRITSSLPADAVGDVDDLSRDEGGRQHDRPALRPDPARVRGLRSPRGGVHHRQRRQRDRPDELSRHRGHEGRRVHASPGDDHPRRPDPRARDDRCRRRRDRRHCRQSTRWSSAPRSRSGCRPRSRCRHRSSLLVLVVSIAVALLAAIVPAVNAGRLSVRSPRSRRGRHRPATATAVACDGSDSGSRSPFPRASASLRASPTRSAPP